jgi:FkbM family methyltransferase
MIQSLLRRSVSFVPWRLRGAIKSVPLVGPFQRRLLATFLEGREFVHTVDAGPARGLSYAIRLPDDKGIWTGTYEVELAELIARAVKPGDVCLDVGGWRGFFSGVMALAGAKRVFVFEPLPANAVHILRMLELNSALAIELIEAAVGDGGGSLDFEVMAESSMGKLATSSFQMGRAVSQKISVRVVGVDELIAAGTFEPPAVLKIDVEGAEMLVLQGARRLLASCKPKLFIEAHTPQLAKECSAFLQQFDYDISVLEELEQLKARPYTDICHLIVSPKS